MKNGRADRRWRTECVVARRFRWCWSHDPTVIGRCRRMHPLSCGNSRCWTCHGDKIFGKPPGTDRRRDTSDLD